MSEKPEQSPDPEQRLLDIKSAIERVKAGEGPEVVSVLDFLCDDEVPWVLEYCQRLQEHIVELEADLQEESDFRAVQSARVVKLVELLMDVGPYVDQPSTLRENIEHILAWTPIGQMDG